MQWVAGTWQAKNAGGVQIQAKEGRRRSKQSLARGSRGCGPVAMGRPGRRHVQTGAGLAHGRATLAHVAPLGTSAPMAWGVALFGDFNNDPSCTLMLARTRPWSSTISRARLQNQPERHAVTWKPNQHRSPRSAGMRFPNLG